MACHAVPGAEWILTRGHIYSKKSAALHSVLPVLINIRKVREVMKKWLSLMLALVLVMTLAPVCAFASEAEQQQEEVTAARLENSMEVSQETENRATT